ncbi:DUF4118 domain-containing protein [Rheinheimera sp.]|uniref:DUF4118 domain-containing protein n=1 Tax=Rheinheimera sp. TaxID=1869214 RepID=UPI00307FB231
MRVTFGFWILALCCPVLIGLVLLPLRSLISPTDVAMLQLLWLVYLAQRSGYKPALLSTLTAVLVVNWCFVPPYYTLAVHDASFVISFLVMAFFGVMVSYWADQARARRQRVRHLRRQAQKSAVQARLEQQKAMLLRSLSHDLRTPLATIMGASSMLADTELPLNQQQRQQQAQNIYQQSLLLSQHFEKVLELSKTQLTGPLSTSSFSSDDLVAAALARRAEDLTALAEQLQLSGAIELTGDMELLEILLANLLENAWKYGQAPFQLQFLKQPQGYQLTLSNALADRPQQADSGYNLGLAICQSIARLHRGQFEFRLQDGLATAVLEWPQ